MDKRMIQAVAGSGKTTSVIEELNEDDEIAIITYTIANKEHLIYKIRKKFFRDPKNIHVFGFFEFLYSFCLKPLYRKRIVSGIDFERPPLYSKSYFNSDNKIYSNQLSRCLIKEKINYLERIANFFDHLYIDEVQDLHSDDFDWLMTLQRLIIPVTLVGDFYQSTLATSRRGSKHTNLYSNYIEYKKTFEKHGFTFDELSLNKSYRCPLSVCEFITNRLGIYIETYKNEGPDIEFIEKENDVNHILRNDDIIKLFYQKSKAYSIRSENWGNSKGQEYENVCVILNPTTYKMFPHQLKDLAPTTLKKLYVACTRTRNNLYFINQSMIKNQYKK